MSSHSGRMTFTCHHNECVLVMRDFSSRQEQERVMILNVFLMSKAY